MDTTLCASPLLASAFHGSDVNAAAPQGDVSPAPPAARAASARRTERPLQSREPLVRARGAPFGNVKRESSRALHRAGKAGSSLGCPPSPPQVEGVVPDRRHCPLDLFSHERPASLLGRFPLVCSLGRLAVGTYLSRRRASPRTRRVGSASPQIATSSFVERQISVDRLSMFALHSSPHRGWYCCRCPAEGDDLDGHV